MPKNAKTLETLLNEVRRDQYSDPNLKCPSIRWTRDPVTGYLGVFNYYDNSIEISSVLNDPSVDEETVKYAIHHENIHQTYSEHNAAFKKIEHQFPNYEICSRNMDERADTVHDTIEYQPGHNSFAEGKKRVVYILLEGYGEEYPYAFQSRDFQMIVDCKCKPNFSTDPIEDFYVFLVQLKDNTAIIVGWSEFGQLLPQRVVKNYEKYGDVDFSYQFVSKYGMIHVIFPIAASYKIPLDAFPNDFTKTNVCVFNANDESIASDIEYVDGYCEGFMSIGFDESRIDAVPQFRDNITPKEIKALIRKEKDTFRRVWMWNALCAIEASSKNLFGRALDKKEGWLLSSALEDLKAIYDSGEHTNEIVEEMIKIYVALDQIANARTLYSMHFSKGYVSDDTAFNKCVKDLLEI